eukprot:m.198951 g.198951  ORF g.198951 m.198951 type:complete len:77 (-) comp15488_c0_seq25:412-642(-)
MHWAAYSGNEECIECLVRYGGDVGIRDRAYLTPLHVSALVAGPITKAAPCPRSPPPGPHQPSLPLPPRPTPFHRRT